jgi:hypothetical protein
VFRHLHPVRNNIAPTFASQSAETLREVAAFSTNENEQCLFKAQSKIEWQPVCLAIVFASDDEMTPVP